MEVKISKNIIIKDWEMHPTATDWWFRPIEHLDWAKPLDSTKDNQEVYVWIHRAKTYYAWEIRFTSKSGLGHLEVPLFRSWELDAAKEYVNIIVKRVGKLAAFI